MKGPHRYDVSPSKPEPDKDSPEAIWNDMMKEAKDCRRTWGMGFPVISMFLLRKYWKRATRWMPPEEGT